MGKSAWASASASASVAADAAAAATAEGRGARPADIAPPCSTTTAATTVHATPTPAAALYVGKRGPTTPRAAASSTPGWPRRQCAPASDPSPPCHLYSSPSPRDKA